MRLSGRFVRVFQWIAPALLPLIVVFGRGALGAPMGWMTVIGMFALPFVIIPLYIPPVIVAFDREAKQARSTRTAYNAASWVTWAALIGIMLTVADGGDSPPIDSVLSAWGVLPGDVTDAVCIGFMGILVIGWIAAIVTAALGVARGRSARPAPARFP
ncbi:hypothetical protein [Microbacterium sp. GXF6406]